MAGNVAAWRQFYDDKAPHEAELPAPFETQLNEFQRMIVLRCIRPDKVRCQSERVPRVTSAQDNFHSAVISVKRYQGTF